MHAALSAAVLAGLVALPPAAALAEENRTPTIVIDATGTVAAAPDTATVTLGVETEGDTPGPALSANNERMGALIEALTAAGVAERDIATSQFGIEPVYVYPSGEDPGAPRITGYRVDNAVTVRIRDIAAAGRMIDEVVRIGANQVRGVAFTVEDDGALLDEARREAIRAARARAEVYAEAGGFGLGRLLAVRESAGASPVPPFKGMARMSADAVPLQPGEQDLSVTVGVEWEIVPKP